MPFEEHQCAAAREDTASPIRSGLFQKGGSELLVGWFLAEADTRLSSRYGAALYKHWLTESTAPHSSS